MQLKTIPAIAFLVAVHTLATGQVKSSETDILTIYKGPHAYKEVSVAGKTTEVYVDDKKVAAGEIPHYDSLIRVMRTDVDADNRDQATEDEQEGRDQEQAVRDQEQAARDREQAVSDPEQAARDQAQAVHEQEQAARERETDRSQAERDRAQGEIDRAQGERDREQGERDRAQGERDHARAEADMAAMRDILHFLVDKKVVSDPGHVNSLVLTDTALYVNGVKQPNEIHQPLKEKYSDWAHNGLSYGDCNCEAYNTFIHIDLPGGR
jgi:colicin import membrane protein